MNIMSILIAPTKKINLFVCLLFASMLSFGQRLDSTQGVILASEFHITRPLSEIFAENPVDESVQIPKAEMPDKKHRQPQHFPLAKEGDPLYGNDPSGIQQESGEIPGLPVKVNWAGQVPAGSFRPYDPSGAVGPSHYIQMINSTTFKVYDKVTGTVLLTGTLGNLWSPATANAGDPIVMYDKPANRWFLAQFGSGNQIYIAVSQTSNPLGAWYTYTYVSSQFPDYLKFGIWHDAYYMTSNQGTQKVFAFNRAEILAGTPGARSIFINYSPPLPSGFFCPLPADAGDGTLPPAGTPCPILSYSDNGWGVGYSDAVNIYNMSVNWVPAIPTATITLAANVATAAFNANYNPSWDDCVQPGTAQKLDGIGGVLMYRSQWKSWSGYNTIVLNWGVEISASQRGIKWCEIRQNQTTGVWSMYQEGIYAPGTDTRWMGTIAMNDAGAIGMSYIRSNSTTMYPSLYYTGRQSCDPLGTLPIAETLIAAGTCSQTGGLNRVGDYSHMTVDPSDGITFWGTSEYMGGTTGTYSAARTRIFSFPITSCGVAAGVSIAITAGANPTCAGQNITFTATPVNGGTLPAYQWKVNGGNVGTNSPTYSTTSLTTGQIVTCVMTSNLAGVTGNPATSNAITITVNTLPSVGTTVTSATICGGATTSITGTGANTYTWNPGALSGTTVNVSPAATMTYTVTGTNTATGCTNTSTRLITVNPQPSVGTTVTSATLCAGTSTSITGTGANTYTWNPGALSGTTINVTPATTTTYTVTGTNTATGCTKTATRLITVNTLPSVGTTVTLATICAGASTSITGTGANTYTWNPGALSGTTINVTPAITTTYTVTGTNTATGCTNTSTRLVTVNAQPSVGTTVTLATICAGGSTGITGTGANTYTWNPGALSGTTINVTPATTTTYTVTGTNTTTGCTKTATRLITVNPQPSVGTTVTLATICAGASTSITGTGANTYTWNPGALSGTTINVTPATTTTYTVTGTNTTTGCTKTATRLITVNPQPSVGTTVTLATICAGASTSITGTGANTYTWNPGALSGTTINVTPATTTTYTVTGTNTATGCTNTSTRLITVNPQPSVGTTVTSATICAGASTSITGTGANTYTWNPGALSGTTINVTPAATTTYTVTGTNTATGCTNTSTRLITVNPQPSVGTTVTSATICAGVSTSITGTGANTYTWNPGALSGTTINVTPAATTTYTVTGTNTATGCTNTSTRLITVNPQPSVGTTVTSATICAGVSTSITGTGANTYTWNPGALSGTTINVSPATTTTYTVTGTNTTTGCTKTATRLITVNPQPSVGTTVTSATICAGASTSITGTGANTYTWNPGALSGTTINVSPAVTTTYTVTGTSTATGCTKTATRTITVTPCGSIVNLKLFIEGYYIGAGLMTPVMLNQGVAGATASHADTITVELRNTSTPFAVAATLKTVMNVNGTAVCNFPLSGNYYLAVKHRNAVQTWSKNPVTLGAVPITYDFSTALNKAYGDNQQALGGGVFGLFSGDLATDENVDLLDLGNLEFDISNFSFGYFASDNNGDGNVDLLDLPIEETNISNFIFSQHP